MTGKGRSSLNRETGLWGLKLASLGKARGQAREVRAVDLPLCGLGQHKGSWT